MSLEVQPVTIYHGNITLSRHFTLTLPFLHSLGVADKSQIVNLYYIDLIETRN